jgi:subtilisin-like proprotein convertase family protein
MANKNKTEINRIRQRLIKFARQGNAGFREYTDYVQTIIYQGQVDQFSFCLETYYYIDTTKFNNIRTLRDYAWNSIISERQLPLLESIKNMFDKKGVYQISNEIRKTDSDNLTYQLSETMDENLQILATSSKIGFTYSNGGIQLEILDENVNSVSIHRSIWPTIYDLPRDKVHLQTIDSGVRYELLTYTTSTPNGIIADLATFTSSTYIDTTNVVGINRLDLTVDIEHQHIGDLQINLTSPNGKTINAKVQGGELDKGTKLVGTTFTTMRDYPRLLRVDKDITGTYTMDVRLGIGETPHLSDVTRVNEIIGTGSSGNWTIYIRDINEGKSGKINYWRLDLGTMLPNKYLTEQTYTTEIDKRSSHVYYIEVLKRDPYQKFVYRLSVNMEDLLGTITEVNVSDLVDRSYHKRSRALMNTLGVSKTYLEVRKNGTDQVITFVHEDGKLSEDMNLYERYTMAVDYLLS